ncbi:MAG: endonuclease III [Candidatus Thermoplasmatota archaeon]|nr:endonuclease III [Candidatus Thermoplasmatota archaeon]MCL5731577.1 endonuclease III [Candidatus Thermoplasmatota archaeon]
MPVKSRFDERTIRIMLARIKEQVPPHHFEFHDPFWVLITTVLSHRTKDEITDSSARSLYNAYGTVEGLASASTKDIELHIKRVGFYRVKAERVKEISKIILEKYSGKVPDNIDDLTKLPGVGRKTANVVLSDALRIPAIAVDTHVQRISRRIGWSRHDDPERTEESLRKIIPKDMWIGFNPMIVEFGKKICRPRNPLCSECSVSEYCDYFQKAQSKKMKTSKLTAGITKNKYIT